MTTFRHEAHRVCVVARTYPQAGFWVMTCAALAAGIDGHSTILGCLLVSQLAVIVHLARRMWTPPIFITLSRPGQPPTLIPIQRSPTESVRRSRHARN